MEKDFQKLMSNKTDEGLQSYMDNRAKFTPEAIEAAVSELKNRGRVFSEDEIEGINRDIKLKITDKENEEKGYGFYQWKKNVVTDNSAPEYFSERAIYSVFSFIWGIIWVNCFSNKFVQITSKKRILASHIIWISIYRNSNLNIITTSKKFFINFGN